MKNLSLIVLLLTFVSVVQVGAQTKGDPKAKGSNYIKPDGLLLLDLHYGTFANLTSEMQSEIGIPGFNVYAFRNHRLNEANTLFFAWGLGFSSYNHHLNGQFSQPFEGTEQTNGDGVFFAPFPESYNYQRNRISAHYIEIPLEFRFRSAHRNPFRLSIGGTVGYALNSFTTTVDDDGKRRIYDVPGIHALRYGLTGRMGVGRFSVYAGYSFSTFLRPSDTSLQLNALMIGINLLLI